MRQHLGKVLQGMDSDHWADDISRKLRSTAVQGGMGGGVGGQRDQATRIEKHLGSRKARNASFCQFLEEFADRPREFVCRTEVWKFKGKKRTQKHNP